MSFGSLPSVLGNGGGVAISVIGGTGLFADGTAAAPSISFAAATGNGFYKRTSAITGYSSGGTNSLGFGAGGQIFGAGDQLLTGSITGAWSMVAGGTNQNITLTPSGTGIVTAATGFRITGTSAPLFLTAINGTDTVGVRLSGASNILNFAGGTVFPDVYEFYTASSVGLRIIAGGKTLIGTTTDSGALLQVGANGATGAALAGMSFGGADLTQYRSGTGEWTVAGTAGSAWTLNVATGGLMTLTNSGGNAAFVSASGGNTLYVGGYDSIGGAGFARIGMTTAHGIKFYTNFSTLALTLDTSQNATFAKKFAMNGATLTYDLNVRASTSNMGNTVFRFEQANGTEILAIRDNGTSVFAGDIRIGNTTAAAAAAPSTHKVSIIIGGVQYYLLASNV